VVKNSIASFAAPMAEVYPDLVLRVVPIVPHDQFLDARIVLPQVVGLSDSSNTIGLGQADAVDKQWHDIYEDAKDACNQQLEAILRSGHDGAEHLLDIPVQVALDLELGASRFIGHLSDGA